MGESLNGMLQFGAVGTGVGHMGLILVPLLIKLLGESLKVELQLSALLTLLFDLLGQRLDGDLDLRAFAQDRLKQLRVDVPNLARVSTRDER